jgi:hypothetical protein
MGMSTGVPEEDTEDLLYLDEYIRCGNYKEVWSDTLFDHTLAARTKRSNARYKQAIRRYRKLRELGYTKFHSSRTACGYRIQGEWSHGAATESAKVRKPQDQYAENLLTSGISQNTGEVL